MDIPLGAFGKLPLHGDFIRLGRGVPELAELDSWLQEGIYRSQQTQGNAWNAAFDSLPVQRFVFHSETTRGLLAGILCPSRDRPGRRYPFLLGARVAELPAELDYEQLPLACAGILDAAESLAVSGHQGLDLQGFTAKVSGLQPSIDPAKTRQGWDDYLSNRERSEFWQSMFQDGDAARRATLLQDLSELLRPPYPPRLMMHLPTSGDPCDVGFRLGVVRRFMPPGVLPTLVQWSVGDGRLRMVFDRLASRYFEPMCWPARDSDHAYDLAHSQGARQAHLQAAVQRFGALASGTGSLQSLQDELRAMEVG